MTTTQKPDPQQALLDAIPDDELADVLGPSEPLAPHDGPPPLPQPICLLDAPPPEQLGWTVEGLFLQNEIAILAAAGGHFKSTLLLAIAGAVAGGTPVFGRYPTGQPGPVLFVSEEDSQDVIVNRVEALIAGMGWDRNLVLSNLHLLALHGARLDDLRWQLHLRACCEALDVVMVCLDPLADLLGDGDSEKDPDKARAVVQFWRQLANDGAAILVAHHLIKGQPLGYGQVDRVRGAGSWTNAARAVYNVDLSHDTLRLECSKANRVRRPDPVDLTFRIETEPGNPASWTSAVFEAEGGWSLPDPDRLSAPEREVLKVLDRHQGEALSWTRLAEESGLPRQRLSEAVGSLSHSGRVRKEPSGRKHAGKPVYAYSITGEGITSLYSSPSPQVRSSPDQVRSDLPDLSADGPGKPSPGKSGSSPPDPPDLQVRKSAPPYRGATTDASGPAKPGAKSGGGPGLETTDDGYWDGLDQAAAGDR